MQTNLVADAVDEILDECESLLLENERLRSLVIHQQAQIEQWKGAAISACFALEQLNSAASGLARVQAAIISRPKKGAG